MRGIVNDETLRKARRPKRDAIKSVYIVDDSEIFEFRAIITQAQAVGNNVRAELKLDPLLRVKPTTAKSECLTDGCKRMTIMTEQILIS